MNINSSSLSTQLTALSDSLKTTNILITRLAKLQFRPGSEPLHDDSGVRIELAQDIHDSLKKLEEELDFLRQEAEDYKEHIGQRRRRDSRAGEEARISAKVARLGEELVHSRQQFRNAQIAAKFASEEAKRKEREALIESYRREAELRFGTDAPDQHQTPAGSATEQLFARRSKHQQQKQLSKDEILVNASGDVTAALRRTHDLLSTELSRSRFAQETFDESTAALSQLGEDYSNLDNILSNSRNLLGTLLRSQKSDTWYLETAFYILIATLSWLFFRRILFGPFVKLPLFFWKVFAFFTNWLVLRPLFSILSAIGVIRTTTTATSSVVSASSSSSRAPLIVQPSAQGRPQQIPERLRGKNKAGIPAGAGGANAKVGKDPTLEGHLSEQIGKMAEESAKQDDAQAPVVEETAQQQGEESKEPVRRGDGTILQDRGDVPKNPKKKQFEADVEDAKHEVKQQRAKRDEL
jgi:protein transport protein SEC20